MNELSLGGYRIHGDVIEIKLRNSEYDVYFQGKAKITNRREMIELIQNLEAKGVTFFTEFLNKSFLNGEL